MKKEHIFKKIISRKDLDVDKKLQVKFRIRTKNGFAGSLSSCGENFLKIQYLRNKDTRA
jgi:hypothetical protein